MFHQVTPLLKIYCEKGTGQKKKKKALGRATETCKRDIPH